MQTALAPAHKDTPLGKRAETILRNCVHCGFCTATCPTYQLLGDELDGPRGRIYQIKEVLEGTPATAITQVHLDRCLTCRACETTCPSGVQYGQLLEIGRELVEQQVPRSRTERLKRRGLIALLSDSRRLTPLVKLGRAMRALIPAALRDKLPAYEAQGHWPPARHPRRVLALNGCVQPATLPDIDAAAARVLDRLGISLMRAPQGCCGALPNHLSDGATARQMARRNIDTWLPLIDAGVEAILVTASGCGVQVKEYHHLLADDPAYRDKAQRVAALCLDPVELLDGLALQPLWTAKGPKVAFHSPCTLQHGQQLGGRVEALLSRLGYRLTPVPDSHLCCGSAGTYSLLQPKLSTKLRDNKRAALQGGKPARIASANIGCILHLDDPDGSRVKHWLQMLDADLARADR